MLVLPHLATAQSNGPKSDTLVLDRIFGAIKKGIIKIIPHKKDSLNVQIARGERFYANEIGFDFSPEYFNLMGENWEINKYEFFYKRNFRKNLALKLKLSITPGNTLTREIGYIYTKPISQQVNVVYYNLTSSSNAYYYRPFSSIMISQTDTSLSNDDRLFRVLNNYDFTFSPEKFIRFARMKLFIGLNFTLGLISSETAIGKSYYTKDSLAQEYYFKDATYSEYNHYNNYKIGFFPYLGLSVPLSNRFSLQTQTGFSYYHYFLTIKTFNGTPNLKEDFKIFDTDHVISDLSLIYRFNFHRKK